MIKQLRKYLDLNSINIVFGFEEYTSVPYSDVQSGDKLSPLLFMVRNINNRIVQSLIIEDLL